MRSVAVDMTSIHVVDPRTQRRITKACHTPRAKLQRAQFTTVYPAVVVEEHQAYSSRRKLVAKGAGLQTYALYGLVQHFLGYHVILSFTSQQDAKGGSYVPPSNRQFI